MSTTRKPPIVWHSPNHRLTEWPACFVSRGTLFAHIIGEEFSLDWFGEAHHTAADILERFNFRPSSVAAYSYSPYSLVVQCKSGFSCRFQLL